MSLQIRNAVCEHPEKDFIIKRKDAEFLNAVAEDEEGVADTTQIRMRTGLTRHQVNHRFERLDDAGFIEIEQADYSNGGGQPPKLAIITEAGEEVLELAKQKDVIQYSTNPREVIDDVTEVVAELGNRLDGMESKLTTIESQVEQLDEQVQDEVEHSSEWMNVAETKIKILEDEIEKLNEQLD